MGLTLNSNSLALEATGGGGGSAAAAGLTTAEVNTLIKAKTDWTLISSIDATGSDVIDFENVFDSTYSTYKIEGDNLKGGNWIYVRVRSSNGLETSGYCSAGYYGRSSSNGYRRQEGGSYWFITPEESTLDHTKTFNLMLSALDSGVKTVMRFHFGGGTSTADPAFYIAGGMINNTRETTGIQVRNHSGSFTSGSVKLYGLN